MRQVLLAGVALTAFAISQASAADLRRRAPVMKAPPASIYLPYDWSGFYVGVHGGGAWVDKHFTDVTFDPWKNDGGFDNSGWLVGGQIGFNWQIYSWVFGIEADGSFADVSGVQQSLAFPLDRITTETKALGTLAARVGYAVDDVLFYAKGGAAWVRDKHTFFQIEDQQTIGTIDDTRWGWMVGAGVEYAFAPDWSLKLEYNFMDFGKETYRDVPCSPKQCTDDVFSETIKQHVHVVKVGLNYRFGGPDWGTPRY